MAVEDKDGGWVSASCWVGSWEGVVGDGRREWPGFVLCAAVVSSL